MKWISLCHVGGEQAVVKELQCIKNPSTEIFSGSVAFTATPEEIKTFLISTQASTRLLRYVSVSKDITGINFDELHAQIDSQETFCVRADMVVGSFEELGSQEIASEIGEQIKRTVSLSQPDKTVFCQIGSEVACGIDVFGDLSKRYYRVFTNSRSMKGTLAATILHTVPLQGVLLDPFGNTGEIAIEAALLSSDISPIKYQLHQPCVGIPHLEEATKTTGSQIEQIRCFDGSLAHIRSAEKNAKLAGVQEHISFSKTPIDWLDVKFSEGVVDAIVTVPPPVTNRNTEENHLQELFHQAPFVLKKGGFLVVGCSTPQTSAAVLRISHEQGLRVGGEVVVYSGKAAHHIIYYEL